MIFSSFEFILFFLPIVVVVYFILNKYGYFRSALLSLIIFSLIFYSFWNPKNLPLLLFSIILNYILGKHYLSNTAYSKNTLKLILAFGIVVDILILGVFKYYNFFIENINFVSSLNIQKAEVWLPLGISFYTFQQIAYLVDSYKGKTKEYRFMHYALFVSFFPQLIAGPIVHHGEMIPQFSDLSKKQFNSEFFAKGIFLFCIGMFKKTVIGDTLSTYVDSYYLHIDALSFFMSWLAGYLYTLQLYFDFSAYSDMAIGLGLMLNIKLPHNFNSPYKADNIEDHWNRWHITLGRFIKRYVYLPLNPKKSSFLKRNQNILIVFLIVGIWHGADWKFVIWGSIHGFFIVAHRFWSRLGFSIAYVPAVLIMTFFRSFTSVYIRAESLTQAVAMHKAMLSFKVSEIFPSAYAGANESSINALSKIETLLTRENIFLFLFAFALTCIVYKMPNSIEWTRQFKPNKKTLCFSAFLFIISFLFITRVQPFIYFDF